MGPDSNPITKALLPPSRQIIFTNLLKKKKKTFKFYFGEFKVHFPGE